jgi:hypothetical protein
MTVDRKTGNPPTIHVSRAAVSITGSIQPMSLALALGQTHFENGLAARLLFCFPPRRQRHWTETEIPEELQQAIGKVFAGLFELEFGHDDDGTDAPINLRLNKKAKKKWIEFYNQHAAEQMALKGNIAAAWSKLEGYAARLALVTHLVRVVAGNKKLANQILIDEISIDTGIKLSRWFGNEADRLYAVIGGSVDSEESERILQLLEYIRDKGGRITARDLSRGPRIYRKPDYAAENALKDLVYRGFGEWHVTETDGRPRTEFVLHGAGDGDGTG